MKTLKDVKAGDKVQVVKIHGEGPLRRRLMDMGLVKGVDLSIQKVAPFGDPVEIKLRGYDLSLRKNEAACIEVD